MTRTPTLTWVLMSVLALGGCRPAPPAPAAAPQSAVQRGEYLVGVLGCDDCHTPKKMTPDGPVQDMARRLMGLPETAALPPAPVLPAGPWGVTTTMDLMAWSGPWGVSYASNLTPDENTGIGIWTEEMFVKAMRTGRHMGQSRPILPPMPWTNYRNLTEEDLKAVYAFLRTLPPASNTVPEPVILPPPPAATGGAP